MGACPQETDTSVGGCGSWIYGNPRSLGVKFPFRWMSMLDWDGGAVSAKSTIPLSDVLVCFCPALVSPLLMVKDCFCQLCPYPSSPLPMAWGSWKQPGMPTVLGSLIYSSLDAFLERCIETLLLACRSVFQSHSEVTESSESLRSLRHNLSVFESPLKIAASILSDRVIICLLRNRRFCNTHFLSNWMFATCESSFGLEAPL